MTETFTTSAADVVVFDFDSGFEKAPSAVENGR
jgi:hypothetical protein